MCDFELVNYMMVLGYIGPLYIHNVKGRGIERPKENANISLNSHLAQKRCRRRIKKVHRKSRHQKIKGRKVRM